MSPNPDERAEHALAEARRRRLNGAAGLPFPTEKDETVSTSTTAGSEATPAGQKDQPAPEATGDRAKQG